MARSFSTATTVTPFQFCPTFTVLGSPPWTASTAALSPITPISATSPARAGVQARNSTSAIILGMKPVAIIRHSASEGPAYFATYLERRSIPWQLIALDAGEPVPRDVAEFSGLALMGGPMSANDPLPWVAPVLELIRDAVRRDVPAIGHCLGGQLMSKAFGGTVRASAVREIGWGEVRVADNAVARDWLGELQAFESFHWHGETFSIPPGATRVLENAHCENQAYALGRHFGMQCHVEITAQLIDTWLAAAGDEITASRASPAVQEPAEIKRDMESRLAALNEVANRIYDRWTEGLSR